MIGMTPFGTTAFKAQGSVKQAHKIAIDFKMQRPSFLTRPFIQKTLATILSIKQIRLKNLKKISGIDSYKGDDFLLEIFSYTKSGVPAELRIRHQDWIAFVNTENYSHFSRNEIIF